MKTTSTITRILSACAVVMGGFALSVLGAWTAPTTPAPGGNISTPINATSSVQQNIASSLQINNNLGVAGDVVVSGNLIIATGTPLVGKMASSDAAGNIKWAGLGPVTTFTKLVVESPKGYGATQSQISGSSCPTGYVLVGFNIWNLGDSYAFAASLYCRKLLY
jgi:hypothetical protein